MSSTEQKIIENCMWPTSYIELLDEKKIEDIKYCKIFMRLPPSHNDRLIELTNVAPISLEKVGDILQGSVSLGFIGTDIKIGEKEFRAEKEKINDTDVLKINFKNNEIPPHPKNLMEYIRDTRRYIARNKEHIFSYLTKYIIFYYQSRDLLRQEGLYGDDGEVKNVVDFLLQDFVSPFDDDGASGFVKFIVMYIVSIFCIMIPVFIFYNVIFNRFFGIQKIDTRYEHEIKRQLQSGIPPDTSFYVKIIGEEEHNQNMTAIQEVITGTEVLTGTNNDNGYVSRFFMSLFHIGTSQNDHAPYLTDQLIINRIRHPPHEQPQQGGALYSTSEQHYIDSVVLKLKQNPEITEKLVEVIFDGIESQVLTRELIHKKVKLIMPFFQQLIKPASSNMKTGLNPGEVNMLVSPSITPQTAVGVSTGGRISKHKKVNRRKTAKKKRKKVNTIPFKKKSKSKLQKYSNTKK